ncbi:uncharacterized protein LOC131064830 [Cryptomeria japonica]|uniref:uncharacterized protein LOC131064830 n=1 Tax=Cryptomeria japonica TaxID=3369 RepID=UPI0025AC5E82|nr:uncharacterized protein LOC131064830 [Cryptomeria japonica]
MAAPSTSLRNPQIPQFNGKNYDYWAITMKALFCAQDLWEFVENGYQEPVDAIAYNALTQVEKDLLKENKKKDSKALFLIFQVVNESIFPRIQAATKSKQAWDILQTAYQGMEKVKIAKLQMLRRDFETIYMKESDTIESFFTQIIGLVNQIRTHGENLEERRVVEKILRSLPTRFESIVVAIEETKNLSQFSMDELHASLISHEHRLSRDVQFIEDEAWDGTLDKTINIAANIPQEENEDFILASTPSNATPPIVVQGQQSGQQITPSSVRTAPHTQANTPSNVQVTPSSIGSLGAGPSSPHSTNASDMSNPTLASLRRQKIRSLREIYEQNEGENNAGQTSLFALYSHVDDPIHFKEAIKEEKWVQAMDEKIDAIEKNKTSELVSLPQGKEVIGVKWVYKTKLNANGYVQKHKARLVAKGYS